MDKESAEERKQEIEGFINKVIPYITSHYEALRLQGERPNVFEIEWRFNDEKGPEDRLILGVGREGVLFVGKVFE